MKSTCLAILGVASVLLFAVARAEEAPRTPINPQRAKAAHERWGRIVLSDGQQYAGLSWTTPDKPIRIFDRKKGSYRDIPFDRIARVEQVPDREWLEREWRWLEGGNDEKVFTDRFYRVAEYRTELLLQTGEKITGDAAAPIYVRIGDKCFVFELQKRAKSIEPALREELKPLVYIKELTLIDREPGQPHK